MKRKPDADGYTYYSQTTSGWEITTNPKASMDRRWRAVHPEYGTRYFPTHDEILPFTCQHMLEQFRKRFGYAN